MLCVVVLLSIFSMATGPKALGIGEPSVICGAHGPEIIYLDPTGRPIDSSNSCVCPFCLHCGPDSGGLIASDRLSALAMSFADAGLNPRLVLYTRTVRTANFDARGPPFTSI